MKKSKLTIIAVVCLICAMALSIFATSVKATTMEFGLQEYRKAREDGAQYGYKISDKYVWKLVTYNGQTIDYSKTIYCLKAEQGFYTSNPGVFRQEYDTSYNLKDKTSMPNLPVAEEDYNSIIWILNHAYIPNAETAKQDKEVLLKNAGIADKVELTDDDIDVIQQLAIWYFTNKDNPVYHTDFAGEPSLQTVLESKKTGENKEEYKAIEDKNQPRFDQMEKLFKYLVANAKNATEEANKNEAPLTLEKGTPAVSTENDNYIIGPYEIKKNNDTPYTLNINVTDRKGTNITDNVKFLNADKQEISIDDIIGKEFYLKIPVETIVTNKIDGIKFNMNGTYTETTATYWTSKIDGIKFNMNGTYTETTATYWTSSSNNTVQPIVVIERVPQEFSGSNEVLFSVEGKYSFKLVKVDSEDINKKLQGAEFEITTPAGTQKYVTDENGEINIADIKITEPGVDTITIKETKAPEPYKMLLEEPLTLKITKDVANGSYTATDATLEGYGKDAVQIKDGVVTITVANKPKIFDLSLKKWVSKAIVTNEDGSQNIIETGHTGDENPEPPAKVDLGRQDINKVTVKFEFQIKVTNECEVAGYVKEITDYIPEGLKFVKEDNPDWYEREPLDGKERVATKKLENSEVAGYVKEITDYIPEGLKFVKEDNPDWYEREPLDGKERVATKKLENTLLEPGESATVSILLTWINGEDNMGLKTNIAEISQDDNEFDLPDIDSTPDNFKNGEDDIDDAPVIITVALGDTVIYIGVATLAIVILTVGTFIIKKYAI